MFNLNINQDFVATWSAPFGPGSIQFNLSGDNGGQWYVTVKDGKAEVTKGTAPSANMTMSMAAQDYVDMITGKLNGQMAFMSGKLKISGDMGLAMKMQTLFKRP